MTARTPTAAWIAAALCLALAAAACTSTTAGRPEAQHAPNASAAQVQYGRDPETGAGIHYQPDVVIVDGGAASVKSVTGDGLTWVINGNAGNVGQLQVGKIMYVTAFGVGRVLAVTEVGADRAITIGPVDITDVVRDGAFSLTKPVDLAGALAYSTPNRPGTLSQLPAATSVSTSPVPSGSGPAPQPSPSGAHSIVELAPITLSAPTVPHRGVFTVIGRGCSRNWWREPPSDELISFGGGFRGFGLSSATDVG